MSQQQNKPGIRFLSGVIAILILAQFFCKSKLHSEIEALIEAQDFIGLAVLCSEKNPEEFRKQCEISLKESEREIQEILSEKAEIPFNKVVLEKNKSRKIQKLFIANVHLGLKYRSIWNESVMNEDE